MLHKKFTTDIRAVYSPHDYREREEDRTETLPSVHGRQSRVSMFDAIRVTGNKRFVDGTIKRTCTQHLFAVFPSLMNPHVSHGQPHVHDVNHLWNVSQLRKYTVI